MKMPKHFGRIVVHVDDDSQGLIIDSKLNRQGIAYMLKVQWSDGSIDWHGRKQVTMVR